MCPVNSMQSVQEGQNTEGGPKSLYPPHLSREVLPADGKLIDYQNFVNNFPALPTPSSSNQSHQEPKLQPVGMAEPMAPSCSASDSNLSQVRTLSNLISAAEVGYVRATGNHSINATTFPVCQLYLTVLGKG